MSKQWLLVFAIALVSASHSRAEPKYDILLQGGHVIDPASGLDAVRDVGVAGGRITRVDTSIPAAEAGQTIDVSGYYVTPGLIDIHAHVFYTFSSRAVRSVIPDDHSFPSGVTTLVDAGTSGADNFEDFLNLLREGPRATRTRVLAFVNISRTGMNEGENDPRTFDVARLVALAKKYPDFIVGFKTAHYWTARAYDQAHPPWASVERVLEAGRLAGLPVMIDFQPRPAADGYPPRSYRELILKRMRPGDIHTHCFAAHIPCLTEAGQVNPDVREAQQRGVIFDLGHGAASFVYKHAVPAIQQGYLPDTISTDMHGRNTANGTVGSMLNVMSKLLNLGLPLEQVIRRSTIHSARAINRPELGNLSVGSPADIAVIELARGKFGYVDSGAGKIVGDRKLQCVMTLLEGAVVFDPRGMSAPRWQEISPDARYWTLPTQRW